MAFDGTGSGPELEQWSPGAGAEHLPPAASLLLAAELPPGERPRQNDRVLLLGVVWDNTTLIELRRIAKGGHLKAGELLELPASTLPSQFRLVGTDGDELVITVPDAFVSEVHEGVERVTSLRSLADDGLARPIDAPFKGHAYTLELTDRVVVQITPRLTLIARYVRAARPGERGLADTVDLSFVTMLAIALLALGLFFLVLRITPRWDDFFGADLTRNQTRLTQYVVAPEAKKPPKFSTVTPEAASAKPEGAEGKVGKPEATQAEAARSKPGAPNLDRDKLEKDRKAVADAPLLKALGALKLARDSATSNVFGPGALNDGINDAIGAVSAHGPMGDARGTDALSTRGNDHGGGGQEGTIGALGTGGPPGHHGLSLEANGPGKDATEFLPGKTVTVGGLSRDEINRVIQKHYNEIKYCYERELTRDPALYGKVEVLFQITAEGLVADAQINDSTMANEAVEGCIVNHVKRWAFPKAAHGGATQVSYPYVFKASAQ